MPVPSAWRSSPASPRRVAPETTAAVVGARNHRLGDSCPAGARRRRAARRQSESPRRRASCAPSRRWWLRCRRAPRTTTRGACAATTSQPPKVSWSAGAAGPRPPSTAGETFKPWRARPAVPERATVARPRRSGGVRELAARRRRRVRADADGHGAGGPLVASLPRATPAAAIALDCAVALRRLPPLRSAARLRRPAEEKIVRRANVARVERGRGRVEPELRRAQSRRAATPSILRSGGARCGSLTRSGARGTTSTASSRRARTAAAPPTSCSRRASTLRSRAARGFDPRQRDGREVDRRGCTITAAFAAREARERPPPRRPSPRKREKRPARREKASRGRASTAPTSIDERRGAVSSREAEASKRAAAAAPPRAELRHRACTIAAQRSSTAARGGAAGSRWVPSTRSRLTRAVLAL